MRKFLFILGALILWHIPTSGQTINAASCSQTDIVTALGNVAADGTTVVIPTGTCHWGATSAYTHGAANVTSNGNVYYTPAYSMTIQGQTVCTGNGTPSSPITCTDNTNIVDDTDHTQAGDQGAFNITTTFGKSFRMTGLEFSMDGSSTTTYHNVLSIGGTSSSVRIDHNDFEQLNEVALGLGGQWYGVVDHNLIQQIPNAINDAFKISNGSWGGSSNHNGDGSWADVTGFGSANWMFIENNTIRHGYITDCVDGGRYVVRFNTWSDSYNNSNVVQGHATGHATDSRSCRAFEVYKNSITGTSGSESFSVYYVTGGTELLWGNAIANMQHVLYIKNNRDNNSTYGQQPPPNGWGYCGTSFNGAASNWDGNTDGPTGYPCIDQVGRGKGDLLSGYFPTKQNQSNPGVYTGTWPHQALEPLYNWGDTTSNITQSHISTEQAVNQNRDFYTDYSSTGVQSGTLASRPSTCTSSTYPGPAYWATDQGNWNQSGTGGQGVLYLCTALNTWTQYYTPFTYPHPLAGGTPIATYTPSSIAFGSQLVFMGSAPQSVTLQNTGTATLNVTGFGPTNSKYYVVNNTCGGPATIIFGVTTYPSFSLGVSASCTFGAVYQPQGVANNDIGGVCENDNTIGGNNCVSFTGIGFPAPAAISSFQ